MMEIVAPAYAATFGEQAEISALYRTRHQGASTLVVNSGPLDPLFGAFLVSKLMKMTCRIDSKHSRGPKIAGKGLK